MSDAKPSPDAVLEALAIADQIEQAELAGDAEIDDELSVGPDAEEMAHIERLAVAAALGEPEATYESVAPASGAKGATVIPWRARGLRILSHGTVAAAAAAAAVALMWRAPTPESEATPASATMSTHAQVEVQVGGTADRLGLNDERIRVYRPGYELVLYVEADDDLPASAVATVNATRTDADANVGSIGLGPAERKSPRTFEYSSRIAEQLSIGRWELSVQVGPPGTCTAVGACLEARVLVEVAGAEAL